MVSFLYIDNKISI